MYRGSSKYSSDCVQLSICLWITPGDWPVEVQGLRILLCAETGRPFDNEELNDQSVDVISAFRTANKVDEQPPAKRRRTAPEPDSDAPVGVLTHLVTLLNGSSVDSPVLDLNGFHVAIQ